MPRGLVSLDHQPSWQMTMFTQETHKRRADGFGMESGWLFRGIFSCCPLVGGRSFFLGDFDLAVYWWFLLS